MDTDLPFDRRLRRIRRDRAAAIGQDTRYLHRGVADELIERLDLVTRQFARALDLGTGDGYLAGRLRERGIEVVTSDAAVRYASGGVQCDEDRSPFADAAFDLVTSIGVLDSVNDLPGALLLIRRLLRPDGLFLGAFAGAGSLAQLRAAMMAADEAEGRPASAHVHPQIDVRAAGDLLTRAGFALPVVDTETLTVRFAGFDQLVRDLRGMAATNLLASRSRRPLGRMGLAAAIADFASHADPDGKIPERFEIIHLLGWGPSPDQPHPARRGSAAASLTEALRARD